MRLNVFLASNAGISRRAADKAITNGQVVVDGQLAELGQQITSTSTVNLNGTLIQSKATKQTLMLNKPAGYVCSRDGQGSPTAYDLLPAKFHDLKLVGRLDKDSTGLILLTDDGDAAFRLTHPKFEKIKRYEVVLGKPLSPTDLKAITETGVKLADGVSKFAIKPGTGVNTLIITMKEGRNRQIRRTFEALGYRVTRLHRYEFGPYRLGKLLAGDYETVANWTKNRYNVVNE